MKRLWFFLLFIFTAVPVWGDWVSDQPASSGINIIEALDYIRGNFSYLEDAMEVFVVYSEGGVWYAGWDDDDTSTIAVRKPFVVSSSDPTVDYDEEEGDCYWNSTDDELCCYDETLGSYLCFETGGTAGVDGVRYVDSHTTPTYSFQDGYTQIALSGDLSGSQNTSGGVTTITLTGADNYDYYNVQAVDVGTTYPPLQQWFGETSSGVVGAHAIGFTQNNTPTINWNMNIPGDWDTDYATDPIIFYIDSFIDTDPTYITESATIAIACNGFPLDLTRTIRFGDYGGLGATTWTYCPTTSDPYSYSFPSFVYMQSIPITFTYNDFASRTLVQGTPANFALYRQNYLDDKNDETYDGTFWVTNILMKARKE